MAETPDINMLDLPVRTVEQSTDTDMAEILMTNIGDKEPGFFKLPWTVREEIYKLALGGHHILPRPDEPNPPSEEARNQLGRLFARVKAKANIAGSSTVKDYRDKFENIVHSAMYGKKWNDEGERAASQFRLNTLTGWFLSCKRAYEEANTVVYEVNIFDVQLLNYAVGAVPAAAQGQPAPNPALYKPQPTIPAKYLQHIRAIHLSTRDLGRAQRALAVTPNECLNRIKHIVVDCATISCNHVPSGDVRHHIPHGRDWAALWAEIASPGKFRNLETIEVNVCGWRVPPGWRRETLAPMQDAARALGRLPAHVMRTVDANERPGPDMNLAKLVVDRSCRVKMFDVYVPWTPKMVQDHNDTSAYRFGFNLQVNKEAEDLFNMKMAESAASNDGGARLDPGWQD